MREKTLYLPLLILIAALYGCENRPTGPTGPYALVNQWIFEQMDLYYYWQESIPGENAVDGEQLPGNFFDQLLFSEDEFSYLSNDWRSLIDELQGVVYETGLSPAFGRFSGTDSAFIVVEFVYPNTPAEEVGMQRGDIIVAINGTDLTTSNYLDLFYGDQEGSADFTLGRYVSQSRTIQRTDSVVTVQREVLNLDPIVHRDIIPAGNKQVGYVFYSRFISDRAIHSANMNALFEDFKIAGVDELIIDLRYNPGGSVSAAIDMANYIVPPAYGTNEDVFIEFQYNQELEELIIEQEGLDSPALNARFSESSANLNISRVYFLVSGSSASASELISIGLQPYMDVRLVGTNTVGKFYGSFVLTGRDANPINDFAIVPVTLKYANSNGFSDFGDGLSPDIEATEDIFQPYPIGDINDPLIAAALADISGDVVSVKTQPFYPSYTLMEDPVALKKGNLFFYK